MDLTAADKHSLDDKDTDEVEHVVLEALENTMNDALEPNQLGAYLDPIFFNLAPTGPRIGDEELSLLLKEGLDMDELLDEDASKVDDDDGKVVILDPREYQYELYQQAVKENTIAVLHTGGGKTLIAVMLIKYMVLQEQHERMTRVKTKITFFLVNIVNLVFQQSSVISANSDCRVSHYCGDMNVDTWSEKKWKKEYEDSDVCVMTAQIFLDCLRHGFISLDKVNLIIFDECHHATKKHAYNVIMREFYDECPKEDRPKIFGMTASPMHTKSGVLYSATQLENNLCSKIYTATKIDQLNSVLNPAKEMLVDYKRAPLYPDTELTCKVRQFLGYNERYSFTYRRTMQILQDLGPWCCDRMWRTLLLELERKVDIAAGDLHDEHLLEDDKRLKECIDFIEQQPQRKPNSKDVSCFSPKVMRLLFILAARSKVVSETNSCSIVFVETRHTALALKLAINALDELSAYRCDILTGHGSNNDGDITMRFTEQNRVIDKFRRGELNLLIATSVAEEGLDIQPCNLVIRFDFMTTTISYIQSRGRARQKNSRFIVLIEEKNLQQKGMMHEFHVKEDQMIKFCRALPKDRNVALRFANEYDEGIITDDRPFDPTEDDGELYMEDAYVVPSTGAKATKQSSVPLLYRYCSCLPADAFSKLQPSFEIKSVLNGGYECIVKLPSNAAVRQVTSKHASSKLQAKNLAALDCVRQLHIKKALTDNLLPVNYRREILGNMEAVLDENGIVVGSRRRRARYEKRVPRLWRRPRWYEDDAAKMDGAKPVNDGELLRHGDDTMPRVASEADHDRFADYSHAYNQTGIHSALPAAAAAADKPDAIDSQMDAEHQHEHKRNRRQKEEEIPLEDKEGPFQLWMSLLYTDKSSIHDVSLRTMCILTWRPFPNLSPQQLFDKTSSFKAHVKPLNASNDEEPAPMTISKEDLLLLQEYNVLMASVIVNRVFTCSLGDMPYFLIPLSRDFDRSNLTNGAHLDPNALYQQQIDWAEVRRALQKELVPVDWRARDAFDDVILIDYADQGRRYYVQQVRHDLTPASPVDKSSAIREVDHDSVAAYYEEKFKVEVTDWEQPLIKVVKINKVMSYLTSKQMNEAMVRKTTASFILPQFCHSYFVSATTFQTWMLIPSIMTRLDSVLLALDARKRYDLDVQDLLIMEAYTTPSASMEMDYERLETLGDSFLKFVATIRLFINFPLSNEGELHCMRIRVICNRSLYRAAKRLKLYRYVTSQAFNRRHWRPHGFVAANDTDEFHDQVHRHMLSDKCLADIVEASLGAAYLSGGLEAGLRCAIAMQIPFDLMESWRDFWPTYKKTRESVPPRAETRALRSVNIVAVQEISKYKFDHPLLVVEALTHASLPNSTAPCYQRLEFLGDAILDFLVVRYLFERYPGAPPGILTDLKDACVNNHILSYVCLHIKMHHHIIHYSSVLIKAIETIDHQIKQVEASGNAGHEFWLDFNMPKVLSDVIESMLGAVFVDSQFRLEPVQELFNHWLVPILDEHVRPDTLQVHPVNKMINTFQQLGCEGYMLRNVSTATSEKDMDNTQQCVVFLHGKPFASGCSDNFKAARREAADKALKRLKDDPDVMLAVCDCGTIREQQLAKQRERSALDYDQDSDEGF
ncbi:hypothetical protein BC940DRAFT_253249 [Gongronella butleri]|nr:hypothetical protein BC940DRAFT_253249 [Gongronella butleri]